MPRFHSRCIHLKAHLSAALGSRGERPRPTSFLYRAFDANRVVAHAVAVTPFLQAMHTGTLDPNAYGSFMVQDACYCFSAQETWRALAEHIDIDEHSDLYELATGNVQAYEEYNQTFHEVWHIRDAESILVGDAVREYAEHERRVALEEEPIYTLVCFLPCYYLWPWFARRLQASPIYRPGVYRDWLEGIYAGEAESFEQAWLLGNFIESWKEAGNPFDEALALDIYHTSMDFELRVFSEAYEG